MISMNAFGIENSSALYKKGARLSLNGKIDEGIKIFKEVIKLSPNYCLGHYGLGKAYLYKYGMTHQAIKHLRRSVELDRSFYKGYFYLGIGYYLSKKYIPAIAAFKKCFILSKKVGDVYEESLYNISMTYDIIGKKRHARLYYTLYQRYKSKKSTVENDPFNDFMKD